jgi:glyoxylase-like metal-dependent hydrolase (beta-lactamase superfamily II)
MKTEYRRKVRELRPGLFQLAVRMPDCHSYVILGNEKSVMIDTGLPQSEEAIRMGLSEIGLAVEDIDLVLLTHEHLDHIGSAPLFFATAIIATHRLAAMKIRLQDEFAMMNQLFGLSADGFRVDLCLEAGSVIQTGNYNLIVVHTPGHSSGSICLYEPDQRLLFAGDTVLTGGNIGGVFGSGSISDYIESVERLKMLQVDDYYPGHGPASENPPREFQAAIDRAATMLADSKALFNVVREKSRFEHIREYMKHLND